MTPAHTPPHANPFRVDCVANLPYLHADATYVDRLTDRLLTLGRAALVGPHGSGKSTLLRSIAQCLTARGLPVAHLSLPSSATRPEQQTTLANARSRPADAIVLLDGYEQLPTMQRWTIRRHCPRLLVTAHRPSTLPTLATLRPTEATLTAILTKLLPGPVPPHLTATAHATFARHKGNVRETLFDLYDAEIIHETATDKSQK